MRLKLKASALSVCRKCGGKMIVRVTGDEGLQISEECLSCLMKTTGIKPEFHNISLRKTLRNRFNGPAIDFLHRLKRRPERMTSAVIVGPTGSGKSHLASLYAMMALRQDMSVAFLTVGRLLERLREAQSFKNPKAEEYKSQFRKDALQDLVVLDELNGPTYTEFQQKQFHSLIEYRCSQKWPTVITTQLLSNELSKALQPDTMSRLRAMPWFCAGFRDMRAMPEAA